MKQSVFMSVVLITSIVVSAAIFYGVFGSPSNFKTPEMHTPSNIMGAIYQGGPEFTVSLTCIIISICLR